MLAELSTDLQYNDKIIFGFNTNYDLQLSDGTNVTSTNTLIPTAVPTVAPSFVPSAAPSAVPSIVPSLANVPSFLPSLFPSLSPTRSPSIAPSGMPVSFAPSATPSTAVTSIKPSLKPSVTPTYARTFSPSLAIVATTIKTKSVATFTKTSITYFAVFNQSAVYAGNMYCAAFLPSVKLTSVSQVATAGYSVAFLVNARNASVTIAGLAAVTTYNVYCYTQNVAGAANSLAQVTNTLKTQQTACCKTVDFTNKPTFVYGDLTKYLSSPTSTYFFAYSLSALPNSTVIVTPVIKTSSGASTTQVAAVPASRTFVFNAASLVGTFYLKAPAALNGSFVITLAMSGTDSSSYSAPLSAAVKILSNSSTSATPAPMLVSAQFGDSGASAYIAFDSATDKAGITLNSWPCSQVFAFYGASTTACSWINSTYVKATFATFTASGQFLAVNSSVTVLAIKVKASCSVDCVRNGYTAVHTVTVKTASNPVTPSVLLVTPQIVSSCANFTIDASLSTGSGGRSWTSAVWTVTTSDNNIDTVALAAKLNSYKTNVQQLIQIPPSMLADTRYSISLTLANFMGLSSSTTVQVAVSFNPNFPTLSILGSTIVSIKPSAVLNIYASASLSSCALTKSVTYSWQLKLNNVVQTAIVSTSKDSKTYQLNGYSLTSQNVYEAVVTATVPAVGSYAAASASASVTIQVTKGNVVGVVIGGYTRSLAITPASPLVLDASKSYDEDSSSSSGLFYEWSCTYVSLSNYGESCTNAFGTQSLTMSSVSLTSALLLKANTYGIQVKVYTADLRQDSKVVSVQNLYVVGQAQQTANTVITTTTTKFNADSQVTLFGKIQATYALTAVWSATVSGQTSSFVSLTAQSKTFQIAQVNNSIQFPLAVAGGNFIAGSLVTFRLAADRLGATSQSSLYAYSEVLLEVNAPPSSGSVSVAPFGGKALSTVFALITTGWVDDVADYPLTFAFTYKSIPSAPALSIKTRDTLNSVSTFFPAGSESLDYVFVITASAYDYYLASSSATTDITVSPSVNLNVTEYLTSALGTALSTGDNSLAVQTVNNVANTFNTVNCSATNATTCANLNRGLCFSVPNTCGACLTTFQGVVGPANSMCFSSNSSAPKVPGNYCAKNHDCLYGSCLNSIWWC